MPSRSRRWLMPLVRLRERLRANLWLTPVLASALALMVETGSVAADRHLSPGGELWFLFDGEAESARQLLSTIASSMMTFTGLVFSITILVLQLASSQFSPRVLRTFLEDGVTQGAMSAFVGTFVFSMALLPEVGSGSGPEREFVPALSMSVVFGLVLLSLAVFVHYIDHMAQAVRAITIIKRVSADTRRCLDAMYPEALGDAEPASSPSCPASPAEIVPYTGLAGVVSAIDEPALLELACRARVVIGVVPALGEFVPRGAPLFRVWGDLGALDAHELQETILIADERTPHQDPAFGFRQLVDIAERALSPGINDPSTAVQALDEIHDLLRALGTRRFPSRVCRDARGALRVVLPRLDWSAYVRLGLEEIRQYGASSIQVRRRMRALLEDLLRVAPPERCAPLREQLQRLNELGSPEKGAREPEGPSVAVSSASTSAREPAAPKQGSTERST